MVIESKNIQEGLKEFESRLLEICAKKEEELIQKLSNRKVTLEKILKFASKNNSYIVSSN